MDMLTKNVKLKPFKPLSTWGKIAQGTWRSAKDPSIYGTVDIDATVLLQVIEEYKQKGIRITPTTIAAKAIAVGIGAYPRVNGVLRLGRIYQRQDIDIFLQVSAPGDEANGDENLSGMIVRNCDQKSLQAIADEIQTSANKIKSGNDESYKKVKKSMGIMPGFLVAPLLDLLSFIMYGLNLWSPLIGSPRDSFGSAMITSIGSLGVEYGFAPLTPYARCPILVAVGKINDKVVAVNGQMVIKPILPLCVTLDHRLIDGYGASKMLKKVLAYFEKPY